MTDYEHQNISGLDDQELDITTRGIYLLIEVCKANRDVRQSLDMTAVQALRKRLDHEGAHRAELASMSFDECEGGACKL